MYKITQVVLLLIAKLAPNAIISDIIKIISFFANFKKNSNLIERPKNSKVV